MRAQATPPRRKWPWILVAAIAAALVASAIYAIATDQQSDGGPDPTATPTQRPTATATATEDVTGCLAGSGLDADTLLRVQAAAPHTIGGAAEVAAALTRWAYQFPYPSESDADAVAGELISAVAPDSFRDLAGLFATNPNLSGGIVPDGSPYRLSTITGVWDAEAATEDVVTISVGAAFVIDGELSSTLRASTTVTLRWEEGMWRADQLSATRSTEDLFAVGRPFTDGC